MNLVAHQFLSLALPEVQIGNLLGEVVKGKDWQHYPKGVQKGILLHREIDTFTDKHPCVKKCSALLHAQMGKYAPVVVDVAFDFYLIRHWQKFSTVTFASFKDNCYALFKKHLPELPEQLQHMLFYLINDDWFENYASPEGQQTTLTGIGQRTPYENNLHEAWQAVEQNTEEIEQNFLEFFPELLGQCREFLKN